MFKYLCTYLLISVNYPVIHVLRISEEAEKPTEKNEKQQKEQKNAKSTVNLAKPLSLHEPKSVAFVEASGCDPHQEADKSRPVQLASIKLHQSTELGPDVYLTQGKFVKWQEAHFFLHNPRAPRSWWVERVASHMLSANS